jgi:DNA-binding MarR family transcriptional regulator
MSKSPDYKNGPEDVAGIVAACRQLHAAIDSLDEKAAQALGIARNDLRCLNLLERAPVSPTGIAQALSLTSGSVTVLLDRLEHRGLVRRRPSPSDRRALLVEATPQAWQALAAIYRPFGEALVALSTEYGPTRALVASQALQDIAARCQQQL